MLQFQPAYENYIMRQRCRAQKAEIPKEEEALRTRRRDAAISDATGSSYVSSLVSPVSHAVIDLPVLANKAIEA